MPKNNALWMAAMLAVSAHDYCMSADSTRREKMITTGISFTNGMLHGLANKSHHGKKNAPYHAALDTILFLSTDCLSNAAAQTVLFPSCNQHEEIPHFLAHGVGQWLTESITIKPHMSSPIGFSFALPNTSLVLGLLPHIRSLYRTQPAESCGDAMAEPYADLEHHAPCAQPPTSSHEGTSLASVLRTVSTARYRSR